MNPWRKPTVLNRLSCYRHLTINISDAFFTLDCVMILRKGLLQSLHIWTFRCASRRVWLRGQSPILASSWKISCPCVHDLLPFPDCASTACVSYALASISVVKDAFRSLVHASVHFTRRWLDCSNALLARTTGTDVRWLEFVQNYTVVRLESRA